MPSTTRSPASGSPRRWLEGQPGTLAQRGLVELELGRTDDPVGVDDPLDGAVPLRVDYGLTRLGRTLTAPIAALDAWARDHIDDVLAARERYDQAQAGHGVLKAPRPDRTRSRPHMQDGWPTREGAPGRIRTCAPASGGQCSIP